MKRHVRTRIVQAVYLTLGIALLAALLTMTGPERLTYDRPAPRGQTGMVRDEFPIPPTLDVVTIARQNANVVLPQATLAPGSVVTLKRQPPGGGMGSSTWVLGAVETSPAVLLNGAPVAGETTLADGDVLTVGGVPITFEAGRRGVLGALDWWETGKVSHLFASPKVIVQAFPQVLKAFPVSLLCVLVAYPLAIPIGLALAFMKMARSGWFRLPSTAYIDFIRGTPLFLQILIVFFGLPLLPPWQALLAAFPGLNEPGPFGPTYSLYVRTFAVLSFNSAAYMAEIFRAGIQSINKGQMEAARSLGMTTPQAMAFVIIPQTVRRILPTMMSEFILLFKDTSLLAAVGMGEMVMRAREAASSTYNVSPYLLAAAFYLVVTIPLGRLVHRLENRLAQSEGGGISVSESVPTIDSEHAIAV
ncbi:amino acid ABC transporter permease [Coriobacteriia bacterium Es71-Z0120]|uniref:ABC transporter permease subunit n=1 Tax=Parvivirga hydrogeniphila TaxID=2939460 RepID=UPI002260EB5B|nr:ABC transporter permease subunit [Parvivirga hydrogeniphila]MCL4078802.1 amino acid ABC transporter permease [Parvivirga hydrogeniphila]